MLSNKFINFQNIVPIIFYKQFKKEVFFVVLFKYVAYSLNILKKHTSYQYNLLSCITGIDLVNKNYRFCICYDLLSLVYNSRIRVKTFINETNIVPSSISVYTNSNWWEREIWDLFGVYFDQHKDLRRILTDYGFEGHPLRKDFPLFGYVELKYSEDKKQIICEHAQLTQEFRFFSFETPW